MSESKTLLVRVANQAARAVVKEIERHTGEPVSMYNCMRLTHCIGHALEQNGITGGPPGEIRHILEQPYKSEVAGNVQDRDLDSLTGVINKDATVHRILSLGGTQADCIVALANEKEALCKRVADLQMGGGRITMELPPGKPTPSNLDRQFLKDTAVLVQARLPDNYGFIVIATPFDGQGDKRLVYTSNIRREDAIAMLKEWLLKCGAAEDWMQHIN